MTIKSSNTNQLSEINYFYIDESFIEIENRIHTIVCAITPDNLVASSLKMIEVKKALGFAPLDEVKINTKGLTQDLKIKLTDGVLDIMYECTAFISIVEGENKQKAAEMIASQIFDYCIENKVKAYSLYFDNDLIPNHKEFEQFVRTQLTGESECIGIQHFNSSSEQLIQVCDVFLGLYRLSMEIEFGRKSILRIVHRWEDDEGEEWSLSDLVLLSTRGQIWGRQELRENTIYVTDQLYPYHCSYGLGVRIKSTISEETKQIVEGNLATTFMGCLS